MNNCIHHWHTPPRDGKEYEIKSCYPDKWPAKCCKCNKIAHIMSSEFPTCDNAGGPIIKGWNPYLPPESQ